jgi:hypothetical protein
MVDCDLRNGDYKKIIVDEKSEKSPRIGNLGGNSTA